MENLTDCFQFHAILYTSKLSTAPQQGGCAVGFCISARSLRLHGHTMNYLPCVPKACSGHRPAHRGLRRAWSHGCPIPAVTSHCLLLPPGLPPALPHGGDPDPGGRGEAHHAESQKPAPAPVRAARLRVRAEHPGRHPPRARPALQQLQRAVPEQLGEGAGGSGCCWVPRDSVGTGLGLLRSRQQLRSMGLPPIVFLF